MKLVSGQSSNGETHLAEQMVAGKVHGIHRCVLTDGAQEGLGDGVQKFLQEHRLIVVNVFEPQESKHNSIYQIRHVR